MASVRVRQAVFLDKWISEYQQHLTQQHLELLLRLVETCLDQQRYSQGLNYARQLALLDPFWEVAQRQLMSLLAYMQHPNEALLQYERLAGLLLDELDTQPEEATTQLYEAIKEGEVHPPTHEPTPHTIVLPNVPFIEPANDCAALQQMLDDHQCRLITIVGIGGIGKTSLATQAAFQNQNRYRDGAYIIPLASVQSESTLSQAMVSTLRIDGGSSGQSPDDHVIDYLTNRQLLLVLDGYEHIVPESRLVQRILNNAPEVRLLVTSQIPLNLSQECLLPIHGLPIPSSKTDLAYVNNETVRLFELTARRLSPSFRLEEVVDDVVEICRIVDGLPLGIVMAAGWIRYLAPHEILAMLRENILTLEAVYHDVPTRHQNFENLINSMLDHLSSLEQKTLTALSIFKSHFDHRAAIAVADIKLHEFIQLVDKSLVQRTDNFRYTIHSIVRHVFAARLNASDQYQEVLSRYVRYYQSWCEDLYQQYLSLHESMPAIDAERHNILCLDDLSREQQQEYVLHIAPALAGYWINRGYHKFGIIEILEEATQNQAFPVLARARGLMELAVIYLRTGQNDVAEVACEGVLSLEMTANDLYIRARAMRTISRIKVIQGKHDEAQEYLNTILNLESQMTAVEDQRLEDMFTAVYGQIGYTVLAKGEYQAARPYLESASRRWREAGHVLRVAGTANSLGVIAMKQGEYDRAFEILVVVEK